jgi:hypothetical protein
MSDIRSDDTTPPADEQTALDHEASQLLRSLEEEGRGYGMPSGLLEGMDVGKAEALVGAWRTQFANSATKQAPAPTTAKTNRKVVDPLLDDDDDDDDRGELSALRSELAELRNSIARQGIGRIVETRLAGRKDLKPGQTDQVIEMVETLRAGHRANGRQSPSDTLLVEHAIRAVLPTTSAPDATQSAINKPSSTRQASPTAADARQRAVDYAQKKMAGSSAE